MGSPEWLKPIEDWIMNGGWVFLSIIVTIIYKMLPGEGFYKKREEDE